MTIILHNKWFEKRCKNIKVEEAQRRAADEKKKSQSLNEHLQMQEAKHVRELKALTMRLHTVEEIKGKMISKVITH